MALQFQPGQLAGLFPRALSGDTWGLNTRPGQPDLQQPMPPQAPESGAPHKGLFGQNGTGWKILGIIGDALQTAGGGQGTYTPALMNLQEQVAKEKQFQQQLQARAQQAAQERAQALEDNKALIDYRNANPTPDSFERAARLGHIDPQTLQSLAAKRAEMLTNPVQLVSDGMGGTTAVRPNDTPAGLQPGHSEDGYTFLGGDPGDPSNWTQGGAASNGGGMFP